MNKMNDKIKENSAFNTPILFTIFNRSDVTKIVFESIRKIRPTILYVAADGPRENIVNEVELCNQTRVITEQVDWPCNVYRKYSDKNMGCKISMSNAINWFFDNVEEGIILEDDCLPNITFFTYCEQLLEKYRDNNGIKMISGDNFLFGKTFSNESYYFSNIPSIWGWATWKRAWKEYDLKMSDYPEFIKNKKINNIFKNRNMRKYWIRIFNKLYNNKVDTWDGQWVYSIYNNNGISITPNKNLVSNIGFNSQATHTKTIEKLGNIPTESLDIIIHPSTIKTNDDADLYLFKTISYKSIITRLFNKIIQIR